MALGNEIEGRLGTDRNTKTDKDRQRQTKTDKDRQHTNEHRQRKIDGDILLFGNFAFALWFFDAGNLWCDVLLFGGLAFMPIKDSLYS